MPSARHNEKKITNETTHTQKDTKNAQSFCLSGSPNLRQKPPPRRETNLVRHFHKLLLPNNRKEKDY